MFSIPEHDNINVSSKIFAYCVSEQTTAHFQCVLSGLQDNYTYSILNFWVLVY